jgi:hypothetical protein
MNHADNLAMPGHGWALASWTIVMVAVFLGLAGTETSLLIGTHFHPEAPAIPSAVTPLAVEARLALTRQDTFPLILTVPFAVTRTQRMMVAPTKHRTEAGAPGDHYRNGSKPASGFLAGLALMGASQTQNH